MIFSRQAFLYRSLSNIFIPILFGIILVTPIYSQYKFSYRLGLGLGFTNPTKFNESLSEQELTTIGSMWFPINYDFSVNIYPSIRVGYKKLSTSLITYNRSSGNYILPIIFRGPTIESFFTFKRRLEANFGISAMYGNAKFMNRKLTVNDETLGVESSTTAEISNGTLGIFNWIGVRMYILSFMSVEGSAGYLYGKFDNTWKAKKGSTSISGGINMSKPFFRISAIIGW